MEADSSLAEKLQSRCCIAGGGPAGMMLGFLLARAGIDVLVLEKHADFLCYFRGDTVHPSTLETMDELGLLEELLKRPHQEISQVRAQIGGEPTLLGNMSYLRTRCRFMALMPQWDFLNFLAEEGRRYPTFHVRMRSEVTGLMEERLRPIPVVLFLKGVMHATRTNFRHRLIPDCPVTSNMKGLRWTNRWPTGSDRLKRR